MTRTSRFGVGKREGHDASEFYGRFADGTEETETLEVSLLQRDSLNAAVEGDARNMAEIADSTAALVVTSPPYFAGKEYETAEKADHDSRIPRTWEAYLEMLADAFTECHRILESGGRIAVNVANLGRKPYRSLSWETMRLLGEAGFLLRGEIIWQKAAGSKGSCAWGSWRSASNPVLRDITERVIVASKHTFGRHLSANERQKLGLPYENSIASEEFMEATLDLWDIPAETATKIGHPAPFPVELPARLISLYTYLGDLVVDPFCGSGSTLIASKQLGRNWAGYDIAPEYVLAANRRLAEAEAAKPCSAARSLLERGE